MPHPADKIRAEKAEAEIERLRSLIDRDRTGLADALASVVKTAKGFDWLCEGRGPYEWDDDRYRMEVGSLICQVIETAETALHESGTRAIQAFHPRAQATARALEEECAKGQDDG